jgi:HEAT repeat protein
MASREVLQLIRQLRDPNYEVQVAAARRLGNLADPASENALLDCFAGKTYALINREGNPGIYDAILSSAAEALALVNTDRAFHALVAKVRANDKRDQLGVSAAVYGLTFSRRPGIEQVLESIEPHFDADSGEYLRRRIDEALARIREGASGNLSGDRG